MEESFARIHRSLAHLGRCYEECRGMEATLSLCWFTPRRMYFGHVDSRVYHLPADGGPIRQITHDDTYVGWLYRNGKINEREARTHPRRNVLQKALGGGNQFVNPQVGAAEFMQSGHTFLLCTDGLSEGLYPRDLEEILATAGSTPSDVNLAAQLVQESLGRSGRDNLTAVVVRVD